MKRIVSVLALALLLAGCAKETEQVYRVVTRVQVEYKANATVLQRTYTEPKNIQSVLTYLRILNPYGPTVPEKQGDTACKITLHYSDGADSVYFQQGNRYLRKDDSEWAYIDRSHATLLYPLLLLLPSDV